MEVNMITESIKFMVLGMGVVFLFLMIMVLIMKVQAKFAMKYFPIKEKTTSATSVTNTITQEWQPTTSNTDDTAKKIAAITAAIQHHRNLKG